MLSLTTFGHGTIADGPKFRCKVRRRVYFFFGSRARASPDRWRGSGDFEDVRGSQLIVLWYVYSIKLLRRRKRETRETDARYDTAKRQDMLPARAWRGRRSQEKERESRDEKS